MSEESDETRRVPPADDATRPGKRLDDTVADDAGLAATRDDATLASAPDHATSAADDATRVSARDDATRVAPAASYEDGSVWAGRAEVRPPRPAQSIYDTEWADDGPVRSAS